LSVISKNKDNIVLNSFQHLINSR